MHARRRPTFILAGLIGLLGALLGALLVASPAQAATGSITGLVLARPTGAAATPFGENEATAYLYRSDEEGVGGWGDPIAVDTDATGHINATGLADGYYTIRTYDYRDVPESQVLASEYYDDGWSPYGATQVHVVNGSAVTLNDIVLQRPGSVQGTVRGPDGEPIAGAFISISAFDGAGGYGFSTDENGHYDSLSTDLTDDLIPGTYSMSVYADSAIGDPVYAGKDVTVTIGADQVTSLDVSLERLSTATFTVTDPDGNPVKNAPIGLSVRRDGVWGPAQYGPICTDDQGRYRLQEGGDSAYKVFFQPATDEACGSGEANTPSPAGTVGEYWDDVYADEDAGVVEFGSTQADVQHAVVLGTAPTITAGTVSITGTPQVGQTLTASPGTWGPSGVTLAYEWSANGAVLPGETGSTLTLTPALEDAWISLRVIGRKSGEKSVDRTAYLEQRVTPGR